MTRIRYRDINFRDDTLEIVLAANRIIQEFGGQALTLRQIYYRFIGKDWFPSSWIDSDYNAKHGLDLNTKNTVKNYKRLGGILSDARYAGLIDWDHVEDRGREATKPRDWKSGKHLIEEGIDDFRLNRWSNQPFYLEIWAEKQTLEGILAPISHEYHVPLMINRGYSSASAMKESAERISYFVSKEHRPRPIILYVGDHDPSGEDMVRDIKQRLLEFRCPEWLDVRKVALTMDQVKQYDCPPNPAKMSDARAKKYVDKHGEWSWEVEALPPDVVPKLVANTLKAYIDREAMDAIISQENVIKSKLKAVAAKLG